MCKIPIVLVCLIYMGLGRRAQSPTEQLRSSIPSANSEHLVQVSQSNGTSTHNRLEPLAQVLLTLNPAAASNAVTVRRLRGGSAKPLRLITATGELQAAGASQVAAEVGTPLSVVASLGGQHRGRRLLNAIFDTDFDGSLQLAKEAKQSAGAWLASSQVDPACLVLQTQPLSANGQQRSAVDSCKLNCFALALSDAIIVHSPCISPSAELVEEMYERIFSHHLAAIAPDDLSGRTMLVHVSDPAEEVDALQACQDAWSKATAASEFKDVAFSDLFDFEVVSMPAELHDAEGFATGVETLRQTLTGMSQKLEGGDFTSAVTAAWAAASRIDDQPSEVSLDDRFLATRAYQAAYEQVQKVFRRWGRQVAQRRTIPMFASQASEIMDTGLRTFDAGVSKCSGASREMIEQRRAQLVKALEKDKLELFVKQHRYLTSSGIATFKEHFLKAMGRSGQVAEWQIEGLSRKAVKDFDAKIREVGDDESSGQLTLAFNKKVTDLAGELKESPAGQLQALGAMRRQSRARKPPKGVRAGLGLVGSIRNTFGGGTGNIQTYAGYVEGLNTFHLAYANDGLIPDSSGKQPPPFRWQPKINFDISI